MDSEAETSKNTTLPEEPGFPLTKEFLETAFKKQVESFETKIGTNPGDNYLSLIHTAKVIFTGDPTTYNYLVKCYPNHPGRREFLDTMNVFDKELLVYADFFPKLQQLAKDSGAEDLVNISVPPFHGGNVATNGSSSAKFTIEPWSAENFIIMTDLRVQGYKMANRINGLDLVHAKMALIEMAKLHSLTWAYKQKHGLQYLTTQYPSFEDHTYTNDELIEQFDQLMVHISSNSCAMVDDKLGKGHPAAINFRKAVERPTRELMNFFNNFVVPTGIVEDVLEERLRIKPEHDADYNKDPWLVGNHGDYWVNNMLFKYDDKEQSIPLGITMVDFQIFREVCPTIDLAYFMYSSIRTSVRSQHKDELLQCYYDTFVKSCDAFQVDSLPGFTFENLKRRFRRSDLFGLLVCLPLLNFVLKPPEQTIDVDKVEGEGMVDVISAVCEGSDKNELLQNEIVSIVLDLYEDGVL